jgi:hypothetical protein
VRLYLRKERDAIIVLNPAAGQEILLEMVPTTIGRLLDLFIEA